MKRGQRAANAPSTVMDHIAELRTRFFVVAVVFIASSTLAYTFRDQLIHLLLSPLGGQKLIYLNPAGGFNFIFLISMYVGLAFTAPLLIQQLYSFIKPALPEAAQKYSGIIFLSSAVLLVAGVIFGYLFAIPGALHFLYSFASDYIVASLTADSYLHFMTVYTMGLGLIFQLPLILLLIHWIKPMTPGGLLKSERWVIVLAFIAAAFITPTPDPLNQAIIALPIIVVYQIGVGAVLLSIRRSRQAQKRLLKPVAERVASLDTAPSQVAVAASVAKLSRRPKVRRSIDGLPISSMTTNHTHSPTRKLQPSPAQSTKHAGSPRFYVDGVSPRRFIAT